jgi:hypothetical protein
MSEATSAPLPGSLCETVLDALVLTPHGQPSACGQVRFVYQP